MSVRKRLVNPILSLIESLNSDTSVSDTQTLEDLEEIQSEVDCKIEALREQIRNREETED